MPLSFRQRKLYINRVDIWRFAEAKDPTTSEFTGKTGTKIASNVPCYFENTDNRFQVNEMILGQQDTLFTTDAIHFAADVDIRAGDAVHKTDTHGGTGYWTIRGDAKPNVLHANKITLFAVKDEKKPSWVGV